MKYKYNDDSGEVVVTEQEILDTYFPYWKDKMQKAGKSDRITEENCIADWVITHWAWEYKEEEDANNPDGHRDI